MPLSNVRDRRARATRGLHAMLVATLLAGQSAMVLAQDSMTRIDALIDRYHELGFFNGSVLVSDGDDIVIRKGYGHANMEWEIPNAPDTKFRIGSISKQFTATLVMQMVEEGKIDLDGTITDYLEDYPAQTGDRITIHQLLNHTSGIVGYTELPEWAETTREPLDPTELIQYFTDRELLFEPGSRFSYSNSAYFLLGMILESVSGKTYEDLLHQRLFDPAGMNDSGYDRTQALLPKRAAGYDKTFDGSYRNTEYLDMTQPGAAGALYSTVEDLYRWDQALNANDVLDAASKARMFTPGLADYGYGWVIVEQEGTTRIQHSGGINGFNALMVRLPEARRLIVLLNNTGRAPLRDMTDGILAILDGKEPTLPKEPSAPLLFEVYQASGLGAALARAEELADGSRYEAGPTELARLADHLLATGHVAQARELAQSLAGQSPDSVAFAELVARAYRADGQRIEAIKAYARAIELSETPRAFPIYTAAIRELSSLEPEDGR